MCPLLLHLNSIEPSIQFTRELEEDGCLPFLGLLLSRNATSPSRLASIGRRHTQTVTLTFDSITPSLISLLLSVPNWGESFHIPPAVVRSSLKFLSTNYIASTQLPNTFSGAYSPPFRFPTFTTEAAQVFVYHGATLCGWLSDAMRRICSRANIRVAFKPMFTCRQQLIKVKDRRQLLLTWGVVFCKPILPQGHP